MSGPVRRFIARAVAVLFAGGVSLVQWLVTSPGVVTYGEFRLLTLAAIPALVAIALARWVDAGEGPYDPDR